MITTSTRDHDLRNALGIALARRRLDPGLCEWTGCTEPAFCFQWIGADPSVYCAEHAHALAEFWIGHGVAAAPYIRLADGEIFNFSVPPGGRNAD